MSRLFEILPGALAWLTLLLMVFFSWKLPVFISVFIILFDVYWLLKAIYLSLHLRSTFSRMKRNLAINWLAKLGEIETNEREQEKAKGRENIRNISRTDSHNFASTISWRDIYHLVIFPMYKEPYEVVRESFETIAGANYPKDKFIVVLATEERAGEEAAIVARRIEKEFGNKFFKLLITVHPDGVPGELPGKGSNESWAAERVKGSILDQLDIPYENILVSVFDVDTQIYPEYFGRLTYVFLNAADRLRAVYQPIPLFINNIFETPALARVVAFSSTFWQMMQQSRPERLTTFSSQSVPFSVLVDIGFWNKDVVSEDSRIFWQCYLRYHGDFRVEPLLYPVSMDANVTPSFWETMKNLYKQQRRWGWGAENIPYMLDGFLRDKLISFRKKVYWTFNVLEGFHSWATNSLMIFALGWLPIFLGGKNFNNTLLSYSLPHVTRLIVTLSMIGIASSAVFGVLLLPPKPSWFKGWHYALYVLQWAFIPVTLIIFGALPGLEAQTRLMLGGRWRLGFWVTPKGRYNSK